jgi:NADH:ubiquinone oxidoreductase subunit H
MKIIREPLFYLSIILVIAFLSSCTESKEVPIKQVRSESDVVTYPFTANGMNYILVRPMMYEGVAIINLTKDSLEVESLKNN